MLSLNCKESGPSFVSLLYIVARDAQVMSKNIGHHESFLLLIMAHLFSKEEMVGDWSQAGKAHVK
jgi:hypothetical protein